MGRQGRPPSVSNCRSWPVVSLDGTVLSRTPWTSRCTTVVSAHSVTAVPARSGPSQNCCPPTVRLPEPGTVRSTSTARWTGSPPLGDSTGGAGRAGSDDAATGGAGAATDTVVGSRSGSRSSAGRGMNTSAGNAMSSDWCGRSVLYSARNPSTAACAVSRSGHTSTESSSSRCRL